MALNGLDLILINGLGNGMTMWTGYQMEHAVSFGILFLVLLTVGASGVLFWHAGVKDKRGRRR